MIKACRNRVSVVVSDGLCLQLSEHYGSLVHFVGNHVKVRGILVFFVSNRVNIRGVLVHSVSSQVKRVVNSV